MGLKAKPLSEVRISVPLKTVDRLDHVRVNLDVPSAQRWHWKNVAAAQHQTLSGFITTAVEAWIKSRNS